MFSVLKKVFSFLYVKKLFKQVYATGLMIHMGILIWSTLETSFDVFWKGFSIVLFILVTLSEFNCLISQQQYAFNPNMQHTIVLAVLLVLPKCLGVCQSEVMRLNLYMISCSKYKLIVCIFVELFRYLILYFCLLNSDSKENVLADFAITFFTITVSAGVCQLIKAKKAKYKETVERLNSNLKESMDKYMLQNKFIAISAHEMRNFATKYLNFVISSIVANSGLLKESRKWNQRLVSELSEASTLLENLLNNTLDVSKLEEGKLEFDRQYESIRGVIELVRSINESKALKKDVQIISEYEANVPLLIELDKSRLTQVLINLVGNALKFTDKKGKVFVRVAWTPKRSGKERPARNYNKPKTIFVKSKFGINKDRELTSKVESANNLPKVSSIIIEEDYDEIENLIPDEISMMTLSEVPSKVQEYTFYQRCTPSMQMKNAKASFSCRFDGKKPERKAANTYSSGPTTRHLKNKDRSDSPDMMQSNSEKCSGLREGTPYTSSSSRNSIGKSEKDINASSRVLRRLAMRSRMSTKNTQMLNFHTKVVRISKRRSKSERELDTTDARTQNATRCRKEVPVISEGVLTIEVTDTGCGMSREEVKNLFQLFVQANKNVHHKFGGSGIGLWLCHKLITAMKGTIQCTSESNQGSTFKITIPTTSKTQSNECYPSYFAIFKSFKVVCLKKEAKDIKNEVTEVGFNMVSCEDMEEMIQALKKYRQERVRNYCILIGYKKALRIKELLNPAITIIATKKLKSINFPYVLSKPLHKHHLVNMLESIVKMQVKREQMLVRQKNLEVLVVDDNELCRNALTALISQYTSKLTVFDNGFKALERLKIKHYDFAVVDQQMPEITGTELIPKIRDFEKLHKACKPMTILLLSGENSGTLEKEAKIIGANAVMTKPLNIGEFRKLINSIKPE
eukprot:TRINITY_DN2778_c0_g1_i14.p1 TRINITY_DN2778_c0_g1~~TRINITY_DN2778_c0_g1_i14.p1  ORF type:complete len:943 (+),score=263.58 TRINITY_DN2778_c0_g1_i14:90-2831(+)